MGAKPFSLRRLTPGERALAHEMFADGLDAARVRVLAAPAWPRAFVAGPSLIVWPARDLPPDISCEPLHVQSVLIHELTHVWQAQNGVTLLLAKLKAGDSRASYAYDLAGGPDFADLNIEQQAMIVQHAFLASRGLKTPHAAEVYADARRAWRRG